jgi:hypothetical protein
MDDSESDVSPDESRPPHPNRTLIILVLVVLLIAVILLVIIVFLGLTVYIYNTNHRKKPIILVPALQTKPKPVLPKLSLDGTAGASGAGHYLYAGSGYGLKTCGDNATKSPDGSCHCLAPYWGSTCQLESYPKKMVAIGWLDDTLSSYSWGSSYRVEGKTTAYKACQDCLERDDCVGLVQDEAGYTLITQVPVLTVPPSYDPLQPVNFYLKAHVRPRFLGVIYLYQGIIPRRFWLPNREDVIRLRVNQVSQLPFYPDNWVNDSGLRLSYSRSYFEDPSQAEYTLTTQLTISQDWTTSWWFMAHL